jgi:YD repeat-containing protein
MSPHNGECALRSFWIMGKTEKIIHISTGPGSPTFLMTARRYLTSIVVFPALLLLSSPDVCNAGLKGKEYKDGNFPGRSIQQGNTRNYYNKHGNVVGKSVTQGDTIKNYDSSGRVVSRSIHRGNITKIYDRTGKMVLKLVQR